jgi:hypothetical protein
MRNAIIVALIAIFCSSLSQAQVYHKVKITLKNGLIVKGSNGMMNNGELQYFNQGVKKNFPLTDVKLVQAKEGKAGKWALGCGGGCLALCIVSGVVSGEKGIEEAGGTTSTFILGSVIWTGIFAGVGALIGSASDHYDVVYMSDNNTSWLKRLDLNMTSNQFTKGIDKNCQSKYSLTLSYRF